MEAGKVSITGTEGGSNEVPARSLKKCKEVFGEEKLASAASFLRELQ